MSFAFVFVIVLQFSYVWLLFEGCRLITDICVPIVQLFFIARLVLCAGFNLRGVAIVFGVYLASDRKNSNDCVGV